MSLCLCDSSSLAASALHPLLLAPCSSPLRGESWIGLQGWGDQPRYWGTVCNLDFYGGIGMLKHYIPVLSACFLTLLGASMSVWSLSNALIAFILSEWLLGNDATWVAVREEGTSIKVTPRPLVWGPTPSPGPELQNVHGAVARACLVRLSQRDISALVPASPTGTG